MGELGALEREPTPMRTTMVTAQRCIDGTASDELVQLTMDRVIRPQVAQHCSAPKSKDLEDLMAAVQEIVDQQAGSVTVKDQIGAQLKATEGQKKVQEVQNAEWDGFQVEDVQLKKRVEVELDPCEKAFKSFDLDGDDIISIKEVMKYLLSITPDERPEGLKDINPFQQKRMEKRLMAMDTDGDGVL